MTGVLLINLGTPQSPSVRDVRRYLREFLSDERVIDIPALPRWLLLNLFVLPTRPRKSAAAYKKIWTSEGSPLLVYSEKQRQALQARLPEAHVELGMRYGEPSIAGALARLLSAGVERLLIAPLYPQYASASTGSSLEAVLTQIARLQAVPPFEILPSFFDRQPFLDAWAAVARQALAGFAPDLVLFSYHGLPERQVRAADSSGLHCLASSRCCDDVVSANRYCYRAHCFATTRGLVERLGITRHITSFQSRLGRTPWIGPYTDQVLPKLAQEGVRRVAVVCPSFVTDCLETLEEIGMRAKESFRAAGGEELLLVPSLNDHPAWIDALTTLVAARL